MIAITPRVQKTMLVIGLVSVALVGCKATTAPKALQADHWNLVKALQPAHVK